MLLSKSCEYGIRASLFLASRTDSEFHSIKSISESIDLSFHFLTKIMQQLTAHGLVESYKGPHGGLKLSEKGRSSSLYDYVIAIDGPEVFTECVLGLPGCGSCKPCPLHEGWATSRTHIEKLFRGMNIRDMAKKGQELDLRITTDGNFHWE